MSVQTNAKLFALRETIKQAMKDGELEKKMDVLKLQAVELGLDEKDLNNLIEEQKKQSINQKKVLQIVQEKKILLISLCLIAVVLEWVIGLWIAKFSFGTIIWLLIVNVLTMLMIVFGLAYIFNKKIKN